MTVLSLLLWMPTASAHYPHDAAIWVAVSPGSTPEWVATTVWRNEAWMLARTANAERARLIFRTPICHPKKRILITRVHKDMFGRFRPNGKRV